jgi:hypothetical protein
MTRDKVLVRFGLGTVLFAGVAAAVFAGCGGSNNSSNNNDGGGTDGSNSETSTPMSDGGSEASNPGDSGGGGDANADGSTDSGPASVNPTIYMVHASPDAPPVRLCFGISTPGEPYAIFVYPPAPDNAVGLYPGTGGLFVPAGDLDISKLTATIYALDSRAVAAANAAAVADGGTELTCDQLIQLPDAGTGSDAGLPSSAYWQLGTIKAGTLKDGAAYLLALTGCIPGEDPDGGEAAKCGASYSTVTGNLGFTPFQLDNTTVEDAGSLGVQFAQASTPWDYVAKVLGASATTAASGGGVYSISPPAADAGPEAGPVITEAPILAALSFGKVTQTTLTPFSGLTFDGPMQSGVFAGVADIGKVPPMPLAPPLALPFTTIEGFTYGGANVPEAGVIQYGKGFVFVLVGDPTQDLLTNPEDGGPIYAEAGATPNLRAAHFLAFPTSNP